MLHAGWQTATAVRAFRIIPHARPLLPSQQSHPRLGQEEALELVWLAARVVVLGGGHGLRDLSVCSAVWERPRYTLRW